MDSIIFSLQQLTLTDNGPVSPGNQSHKINEIDMVSVSLHLWRENQHLKREIERLQGILFKTNEPNIPKWIT